MRYLPIVLFFFCATSIAVAQTTFYHYRVNNLGYISIPSNMEEQSGTYKVLAETFQQQNARKLDYEIDFSNRIVFQQKGVNAFEKTPSYARVIVKTIMGSAGDYNKLSYKLSFSASELQKLSEQNRSGLEQVFNQSQQGQKLLTWHGLSIVTINGVSAYKFSYVRQLGNNSPVYVELYQFENYDRMHELTLSYRLEDASTWKPLYEKVLNSFVITSIR